MIKDQIRITDGYERTVDILLCNDSTYQIIMFEASSDYHQNAWFKTEEEAKSFAERWVFKK
jgi:hypothetical protein